MRTIRLVACAVLLTSPMLAHAGQSARSAPSPVTVSAMIEAIDKANRVVTLTKPEGGSVQVKAPEQMEGFNSLRVGDRITATYHQAIAVSVRKPGAPVPPAEPIGVTQRKQGVPGSETRSQQTFTVTVEAIDAKQPSLTVKGPQGGLVVLLLQDAAQLQSIKVKDTVDVTYYESLLVKVARPDK